MKNLLHSTKRFSLKKVLMVVFVLALVLTPLHQTHAAWFLPLVGLSGSAAALFQYFVGGLGGATLTVVAWLSNFLKGAASLAMTIAGTFFDYALQLSINFDYNNISAIEVAWSALRDVCNVIFIFMLIYLAIDTILGTSTRETVRKLVYIVLVALVINFSLLATKVIVDTSNVATLAIYNQVATEENKQFSLSFTLIKALKLPQDTAQQNKELSELEKGNLIIIDLFSIVLFAVVTWVLFEAAFMLVGRLVTFILLMIFSPLAFIGLVVPYSGFKENTTDWWWKLIVSQAVFAPVFLFLFLVTLRLATDPNLSIKTFSTDHGIDVSGLINFSVLIGMVYMSIKIAKSLGGGASQMALGWGNWATGLVAGKAAKIVGGGVAGTLGLAGRATGGAAAYRLLQKPGFKKFAASNRVGQMLYTTTGKLASGSWDFRNTAVSKGAGKLGVDLGNAGGVGGYTQRLKDQIKARDEFQKTIGDEKVFLDTPEGKKAEEDYNKLEREEEVIRNGGRDSSGTTVTGLLTIEKELTKAMVAEDKGKIAEFSQKKYEALKKLEKTKKAKTNIENNPNLKRSTADIYGQTLKKRGDRRYGLVTQFLTRKANKEAGEAFNKEYQKKKDENDKKWLQSEKKKRKGEYEEQIKKIRERKLKLITQKESDITEKINTEEKKRKGTILLPQEEEAIEKRIGELRVELNNFRNGSFAEDREIQRLDKEMRELGNTEEDLSETIKKAMGGK